MKSIHRIAALAAALLLVPWAGSHAEVTAEKIMDRKQVQSVTWRDENGNMAPGPEGYAQVQYEYAYQVVTERYFDAEGMPCKSAGGTYGKTVTRDTRNRIASIEYLGLDGQLMANAMGYAKVTYKYFSFVDAEQLVVFYGTDGNPAVVPSLGYAQVENQYNGVTLTARIYMDEAGNPKDCAAGYATLQRKMNRQHQIIRVWYEHADGTPAQGPDGWSRSEIERDPNNGGKITKIEYFDAQGGLTAAGGCAREEYAYRKDGQMKITRFDTQGNVIPFGGDVVSVRRRIKNDLLREETFLNEAGEPTALPEGYAGATYSYNNAGQLTLVQYLDAAGEKTTCRQGYSAVQNGWDAEGRLQSRTYLDVNGKPVNDLTGVAVERYDYDEEGMLSGTRQYDASGAAAGN